MTATKQFDDYELVPLSLKGDLLIETDESSHSEEVY